MKPRIPRPRSRRWLGFFLVLAVLAGTAIVVPIAYNLSIQLRPDELIDAIQRWDVHRPADYDLEYLVKTRLGKEEIEEPFFVAVRSGHVKLAARSGELVYLDSSLTVLMGAGMLALSSEDPRNYGVEVLFGQIKARMYRDEQSGQRSFATAQFDAQDGHPSHYVYRSRGRKERVEWNIKLTRIAVNRESD